MLVLSLPFVAFGVWMVVIGAYGLAAVWFVLLVGRRRCPSGWCCGRRLRRSVGDVGVRRWPDHAPSSAVGWSDPVDVAV